eukprot:jgi/Tetstr1/424666/TSEL_015188.t1
MAAAGGFPLECRSVPGRGRGLFATRDILPGETVLVEAPLLLIPLPEFRDQVCAQCLRALTAASSGLQCTQCQQARFCSAECGQLAQASTGNHTPLLCRCLAASQPYVGGCSSEEVAQLHFLLRALTLKLAAAQCPEATAAFQALVSVVGDITPQMVPPVKVHQALCATTAAAGLSPGPPMTIEEAAVLLRKEELNSYGVMAPSAAGGERRIRGSGMYVHASLLNHECLPNVVRYDDFDSPGPGNTRISMRALAGIPAGSEVLQSYFPLNWSFRERQERCQEQYGFQCGCPRCQLEQHWEEGESDMDGSEADEGSMEEEEEEAAPQAGPSAAEKGKAVMQTVESASMGDAAAEDDVQDTYQYMFITKHLCQHNECFGTMAPTAPNSEVLQCNMCGSTKTEAEFLAELELQQRDGEEDME